MPGNFSSLRDLNKLFNSNAEALSQMKPKEAKYGIHHFISQITKAEGLARPTRFEVEIYPPKIFSSRARAEENSHVYENLQTYFAERMGEPIQNFGVRKNYFEEMGVDGQDAVTRLKFMCHKAELPSASFSTSDARTYGSFFKIPYVDTYTDITLEFIVGSDMFERKFFEAWKYTIQDPETADFNYVDEYATVVVIWQQDEYGINKHGVTLFQTWPISIGSMELSYDMMNQYHTLPVTFTFRKWISNDIYTRTPTDIKNAGGNSQDFESTIQKP